MGACGQIIITFIAIVYAERWGRSLDCNGSICVQDGADAMHALRSP